MDLLATLATLVTVASPGAVVAFTIFSHSEQHWLTKLGLGLMLSAALVPIQVLYLNLAGVRIDRFVLSASSGAIALAILVVKGLSARVGLPHSSQQGHSRSPGWRRFLPLRRR